METRKHAYGPAVDLWSAGIILFMLLGGYPPFYSENEVRRELGVDLVRCGLLAKSLQACPTRPRRWEMFAQIRTGD